MDSDLDTDVSATSKRNSGSRGWLAHERRRRCLGNVRFMLVKQQIIQQPSDLLDRATLKSHFKLMKFAEKSSNIDQQYITKL